MVLDKITDEAKKVSSFEKLTITAQVSIVYVHIEAARKLSVPLSAICEALNAAGSKVTVRYLREALSVVRRRLKANGGLAQDVSVIESKSSSVKPSATAEPVPTDSQAPTPKAAREQKADSYMASSNPLLASSKNRKQE